MLRGIGGIRSGRRGASDSSSSSARVLMRRRRRRREATVGAVGDVRCRRIAAVARIQRLRLTTQQNENNVCVNQLT